jgi:hypothetical protein
MEKSEEGDAREIAAWQIVPAIGNYVWVAAALSDKKIYTGADIVDSPFRLAGVF